MIPAPVSATPATADPARPCVIFLLGMIQNQSNRGLGTLALLSGADGLESGTGPEITPTLPTGADRKPTQESEARDCSAASDWTRTPCCFGALGESELKVVTIRPFFFFFAWSPAVCTGWTCRCPNGFKRLNLRITRGL